MGSFGHVGRSTDVFESVSHAANESPTELSIASIDECLNNSSNNDESGSSSHSDTTAKSIREPSCRQVRGYPVSQKDNSQMHSVVSLTVARSDSEESRAYPPSAYAAEMIPSLLALGFPIEDMNIGYAEEYDYQHSERQTEWKEHTIVCSPLKRDPS
jgi:hypothetical protein